MVSGGSSPAGAQPASSCPSRAARTSGGGGAPPRRPRGPDGPGPGPARPPGRAGPAVRSGAGGGGSGGPAGLAPQDGHEFAQRGRASYLGPAHQSGLADVAQWDDQAGGPAASARAIIPGTWRNEPFSPSSPQKERPSVQPGLSSPAATRRPTAIGRSRPAPPLRTPEGARLTDRTSQRPRQPAGQDGGAHPVRDSRTAASGNPTMVKPGGRWRRGPRPKPGCPRLRSASRMQWWHVAQRRTVASIGSRRLRYLKHGKGDEGGASHRDFGARGSAVQSSA